MTANYSSTKNDVPYIEASSQWGDNKFDVAGVRFKGNSSYIGANTRKKPFHIKLNEFVKGQKIEGIASFSLSNTWNDPSFVREKACCEVAAAAGLKAPRANGSQRPVWAADPAVRADRAAHREEHPHE